MKRHLFALAALALIGAARLSAQSGLIYDEVKLDPMREKLKANVLVLRDTLFTLDASAARLVRANTGQMTSVVVSTGRVMRTDCLRAARATALMRTQMAEVGTNDARGKGVIADYKKGLDALEKSMKGCDARSGAALDKKPAPDNDELLQTAVAAQDAIKKYEWDLQVLLKTLQIPVDPKGFKSAIRM